MSPTRKCLSPLCPSGSKFLATPLQSTAIFIFLRGVQCPLSPSPAGAHVPHKKIPGSRVPSTPKILGTPLKSAHVFKFQKGVAGKCPLSPPRLSHITHQEMPWPLVPLWFKVLGYATAVNSHFHIFERGPVPLVPFPRWRSCPPQENTWVTCALYSKNPGYATEISTCF